jgi:GntR family transcriptional regulator / MocR family aminotransferase
VDEERNGPGAGNLDLALTPGSRAPLYLQIAEAVRGAILDGRFKTGMALPGVRILASRLDLTVNTVLAALRELQAQGWLSSMERRGFFVTSGPESEPAAPKVLASGPATPGFDLPSHLLPLTAGAGTIVDLSEGLADARLAPHEALGRAYQRGLRLKGPQLLGTRDPQGLPRLREALAGYLRTSRHLAADPSQILVLRSTAMILTLVAQTLVGSEGGDVAMEDPGHPDFRETLRQACPVRLHGLPVDEEGLQVEPLQALAETCTLRLLLLTPASQMPTAVGLAASRRERILSLCRQHRIPILELDLEHDYQPGAESLAAQDPGQVLHVGSVSRIFAPGLGASYLVVPPSMASPLARARLRLDWQGDPPLEWALSELFLEGEIGRQVLRLRKAVRERGDALQDALQHHFGDRLAWRRGPTAFWLEGKGSFEASATFNAWIKGCQYLGLRLRPGRAYRLDGSEAAATRLGFSSFTPEELQQAVARMA